MSSATLEGEIIESYRPLSGTAMLGLALGAASFLAFLHPVLLFVPLLGVVVNVAALRGLARASNFSGRGMALLGLALSLLIGVFEPVRLLTYDAAMQSDAQKLADEWFEHLRRGEPEKAYLLTLPQEDRRPLDDNLWMEYRKSLQLRSGLTAFVNQPVVRTLLALGDKAKVRFYASEGAQARHENEIVNNIYAVTFDRDGETISFFIKFSALRTTEPRTKERHWRNDGAAGGHVPTIYPGEKPPKFY